MPNRQNRRVDRRAGRLDDPELEVFTGARILATHRQVAADIDRLAASDQRLVTLDHLRVLVPEAIEIGLDGRESRYLLLQTFDALIVAIVLSLELCERPLEIGQTQLQLLK